MRTKPLLIWFAMVVNSARPNRSREVPPKNTRDRQIMDLIGQGKRDQVNGDGCFPPKINPNIKLFGEVNKDCEYFGELFWSTKMYFRSKQFSIF